MSNVARFGLALVGGAAIALGGLWLSTARAPQSDLQWRGESDTCPPGFDRAHLDEAIALGRAYLLHNQEPDGTFVYQWDWKTGEKAKEQNWIRQAGTTWGLGLVYRDHPDAETLAALEKAIAYWTARTTIGRDSRRWTDDGNTATVALVGLAIAELLRVDGGLPEDRRAEYDAALGGYLAFVASMRAPLGGFYARYETKDGDGTVAPNPYCDGESLLFLVTAARYLGRDHLRTRIELWAQEDWALNVKQPREAEPDPDQTKGYYQWGSMAWFEIADAGWDTAFGDLLMDQAVWMIDDHRTLKRKRNTAYAYEGIIPAWEWARRTGDPRARKFACVAHQALPKLMSWQVGHSLANGMVATAPDDPRFVGGIQNEAGKPGLRIDVVQHQTHAMMFAREFGLDAAEL